MEQERDSKEYAWKWVTASELLSPVACDLCYALLTSPDNIADCTLYDGQDTNGTIIANIESLANRSTEFTPPKPIYCRRGLYVAKGTRMKGVLIEWRPRASKEG